MKRIHFSPFIKKIIVLMLLICIITECFPLADMNIVHATTNSDEINPPSIELPDEGLKLTEDNFPDEIFRDYIISNFDLDKNLILSENEITLVESIDVANKGIFTLKGIENFPNLLYLYCNGNKLRTLNVDSLSNLIVLDCSYNYLTSLDLSNCSSLLSFEGVGNALSIALDETNTYTLSKLPDFNVGNAYDWSDNVTINDKELVLSPESESKLITYRMNLNAPLLSDSYIDFSLVIEQESKDNIFIDEETFEDSAFRDYLKDTFDLDHDLILSTEELNSITYLYIPERNISSLSGIEKLYNLVYLNFDGNLVQSVDLNELKNLRSISCSKNALLELSIDQLPKLETLYCNENQLCYLDLSNCSSLKELECANNISEVFVKNDIIDLPNNLDLSRTSDWSSGSIISDNNITLEEAQLDTNITYNYKSQSPNESYDSLPFTLTITNIEDDEQGTDEIPTDISESSQLETDETAPSADTETTPQIEEPASVTVETTPALSSVQEIKTYTVTFNSNGGSNISPQIVPEQNLAVMPAPPVKSGYLFAGWYNGDTQYDFSKAVTSEVTLTAHWNKVAPKKPTIKSLKNSSKSKMKITFTTKGTADGYEVYYSTSKNAKKNAVIVDTNTKTLTVKNLIKGKTYYVRVRSYTYDSTGQKVYSSFSKIKKLAIKKGLGEEKATSTSATISSSKLTSKNNIKVKAKTKNIVKSNDNYYYLFALPSYKKSVSKNATPLAYTLKSTSFEFNANPNLYTASSLLNSKFVVAVKVKSGFQIISKAKYITNPEKIADFTYAFPKSSTKKGLQINATMLNDVKDLGVKHSAFNIPLNLIIAAPGENNYRSSVDYEYNGKTYWFRKSMIAAYDSLFRNLEKQNIVATAIVLLGWRDDLTHLITPGAREEGHLYYNFNTSNKAARNQLEATFTFLAERYASGSQNGKIVNWIIGNEINSFEAWHYAGTKSLSKHAQLYADSYRLAYTAIKSVYRNARLYVPLDQCWTISNSTTFGGKEFLNKFDSLLKEQGDISWNLAYHAYASPLTDTRFWKNSNGLSKNNENSPVISISNLSVLTKYIKKHYGKNTRIILSEQGFSSAAPYGEKTQAAAIAYAYYLAEFNSMIDAFILSRHVDNKAETNSGLNLGLWTNEPGQIEEAYKKKYAWTVYKYMDTPDSTKVTNFALKIIGAKNWKKIVPNYKQSKLKSMPKAN